MNTHTHTQTDTQHRQSNPEARTHQVTLPASIRENSNASLRHLRSLKKSWLAGLVDYLPSWLVLGSFYPIWTRPCHQSSISSHPCRNLFRARFHRLTEKQTVGPLVCLVWTWAWTWTWAGSGPKVSYPRVGFYLFSRPEPACLPACLPVYDVSVSLGLDQAPLT